MKIKELQLENFRHLKDTEIEFGDKLTVISGQNGTGKSSILGWVAQLCDFKGKSKRLNSKSFKEDFQKVFRFCPTNDYSKKYKVIFHYIDENEETKQKIITTRFLNKTGKSKERYKADFDGRGRAIDFPVIYLGLKRLIPLATENKITIKKTSFENKYINQFSRLSKDILLLVDEKIEPESIKSFNKDSLAMKTKEYNHLGNSAGQDNLGQIISSILSFQKLKEELKEKYQGGIILIDEIDSTLYAASQIHLIKALYRYAGMLNLQIIFSTHSLEILEYLESYIGKDTKINYLVTRDGIIKNELNPSFEYISNKIKNQKKQHNKIKKKQIVCEDKSAEYWIKNMLNGSDIKKMVKVEKGPFPDGTIVSMAESQHQIFKEVGFVLDGDVRKKFGNKKHPPKTVFLPELYSPETIMYEFVRGLSDSDEFWNDAENLTKLTCFGDYLDSGKGSVHKRWFNDPENKSFFGTGYSKLFNRWKKDNKPKVEKFQTDLRKII